MQFAFPRRAWGPAPARPAGDAHAPWTPGGGARAAGSGTAHAGPGSHFWAVGGAGPLAAEPVISAAAAAVTAAPAPARGARAPPRTRRSRSEGDPRGRERRREEAGKRSGQERRVSGGDLGRVWTEWEASPGRGKGRRVWTWGEFWVGGVRRRQGGGNEGLAAARRARVRPEGGGAYRRGLSECRVCGWMAEGARARRSRI